MDKTLEEVLLDGPVWDTCTTCGKRTQTSPCYDCMLAERHKRSVAYERKQNIERTLATVPERFRWATGLDAPALPKRATLRSGRDISDASHIIMAPKLLFQGRSGSGKSSLAAAMFFDWAQQTGKCGTWISADELALSHLSSRLGEENKWLAASRNSELVVLDDFGSEQRLPGSLVPALIQQRYNKNAALWVTSGFSSKKLRSMYGDNIMGRIEDGARQVVMNGGVDE